MAIPKELVFKCTNRWGIADKGILPCKIGKSPAPDNQVRISLEKVPAAGTKPDCPGCGQPMEPVSPGQTGTVRSGSKPLRPGPRPGSDRPTRTPLVISIFAILIVALIVGYFVYPLVFHPKLQLTGDAILLNTFQPTKQLKIENIGNTTLLVKISPGRDAVLVNPSTLNIKPGEIGLVDLSLDAAAMNVTEIDTSLDLQTNDPKFPHFPVTLSWRNVKRSMEETIDQVHHDLYRKSGAPN
jgi:hypothetical protein